MVSRTATKVEIRAQGAEEINTQWVKKKTNRSS